MIQKKKINYYFIIVLILVFISVGYAILNNNLKINGKSHIYRSVWDIHFENVVLLEGSSSTNIPNLTATSITVNTELNNPGDYYGFSVDIVNKGTISAVIDNIEFISNVSSEQEKYLNFSVLYDDGNNIDESQILFANQKKTLNVYIEFKKDINPSDLPENVSIIDFILNITYVQIDNTQVASLVVLGKSWTQLPGVSLYDAINNKYEEMKAQNISNYPRTADEYTVTDLDANNVFVDNNGKILNLKNVILEPGKNYNSTYYSKGSKITDEKIVSGDYVTTFIDVTKNVSGTLGAGLSGYYIPVFVDASDTYTNVVHSVYPSGYLFANPLSIEVLEQEILEDYILGFPSGQNAGCGVSTVHEFFFFEDDNGNLLKITDNVNHLERRTSMYFTVDENEMTWEEAKEYIIEYLYNSYSLQGE